MRFYAAEALAYLDRREAAEPLGQTARNEPAFRMFALTAPGGHGRLRGLRATPRPARRAQRRDPLRGLPRAVDHEPHDPLVRGEHLGGQFSYHVLDTPAPPMIHVTRSRGRSGAVRPRPAVLTPLAVNAGSQIMVTSTAAGEIPSASSRQRGRPEARRFDRVDEVIRAIVELGGTYPDVVQALQEAKAAGALPGRFEVEALPRRGRTYPRMAESGGPKTDRREEAVPPRNRRHVPGSLLE